MTELQLGKYEFYPNEKVLISLEDLFLDKDEQQKIENKFLDAARKYLAEKEAKKKNTRKRKK